MLTRSDGRGVLRIDDQDAIYGSSPSTSRYLNFNEQNFRLYLGMASVIVQVGAFTLYVSFIGGAPQTNLPISSSFNGCISRVSLGPLGNLQTLELDSADYGIHISHCNT